MVDRPEHDKVRSRSICRFHLGQRGRRASDELRLAEDLAGVANGKRIEGKMDTVGTACEGDIDAIVDEEHRATRRANLSQLARECEQFASPEILLAKLHRDRAAMTRRHG